MDNKTVIFISGKYRGKTTKEVELNIFLATEASKKLWKLGYIVICPHLNTSHFDGICEDDVWLNGYLEILKRCDAIYMLNNWLQSEGAIKEYELAEKIGIKILFQSSKL